MVQLCRCRPERGLFTIGREAGDPGVSAARFFTLPAIRPRIRTDHHTPADTLLRVCGPSLNSHQDRGTDKTEAGSEGFRHPKSHAGILLFLMDNIRTGKIPNI